MRNKIILTFLAVLICCSASAQATQVSVEPAYLEVSEGGVFTVNITVYPEGNEVMGAQYDLYFDNAMLNATDQTPRTFLNHDGSSIYEMADRINNTFNNTHGKIEYGAMRTGVDYGVTDPGVLTTITFQAIASHGTSGLLFDRVKLSRPNATYITGIVVNNGNVEIVSGICGDVNDDGNVNMADVMTLWYDIADYPTSGEWVIGCC